MPRYLTVERYNTGIHVFTEQDNYKQAIDHPDTAEWVWQFAASPKQAKAQHTEKSDKWLLDPTKETY